MKANPFTATPIRALVFALLSTAMMAVGAQDPARRATAAAPDRPNTCFVSCETQPTRSRAVRSSQFVSPATGYRAYVEVTAIAPDPKEIEIQDAPRCSNTSKLYISTPKSKDHSLAFQQDPTSQQLGNGLKISDWSADGRTLALELCLWQYDGDGGGKTVLVYMADRGRAIRPNLHRIVSRHFGKDCAVRLDEIRGFTPSNQIVIKIGDYTDPSEYGPQRNAACLGKDGGLWALNWLKQTVRRLPGDYQVRRFGTEDLQCRRGHVLP